MRREGSEAALTAAQSPNRRFGRRCGRVSPAGDAGVRPCRGGCVARRRVDDAPRGSLVCLHESTRLYLLQPRRVQTAAAPAQRTDADAEATRRRGNTLPHGPRALWTHHDMPAQLRGVVATTYAVAAAARRAERRRSLAAAGSSGSDSNCTAWAGQPWLRRATAGVNASEAREGSADTGYAEGHHRLGRSAAMLRGARWQRDGETESSERWRVSLFIYSC